MQKLNRSKLRNIYEKQELIFPMIGAVIEGNAEGEVFCNNNDNPTHIFVVNKFGFCQEIFEERDEFFFDNVIKGYIENRDRKKLRLYNPQEELFQYVKNLKCAELAKRMHFVVDKSYVKEIHNKSTDINEFAISVMIEENFAECFGLDLAARYYVGKNDFCNNAIPIIAKDGERIAGIIYSVANDNERCEVDIFVDEKYRNKGIAQRLVGEFVKETDRRNWTANWDCYTNNIASMNVAKKCGFVKIKEYFYFNINNEIT